MPKRMSALLIAVLLLVLSCVSAYAEEITDPFTPMPDGTTLKVAMGYSSSELPGVTPETTSWNEIFKHYLNVDLDWMWVVPSEQYDTKLSVSLAANEVPDVMRANQEQFLYLLEAGYLRPLDEAFEQYGSGALKEMYAGINNQPLEEASRGGQLYAIPRAEDTRAQTVLLWVREDWLNNLGLEAPNDLDSLLEVMRAFTHNDPDQNGENDTYGFGLRSEITNGHMGGYGVFEAFGAYPEKWILKDGNVVNGSVQSEAHEALNWLRAAYAEGLIDPEFATLDTDQMIASVASGKIGMTNAQWYVYDNWFTGSLRNDENCVWIPLPAVSAEKDVPANAILNERMSYEFDVVTLGAPDYAEEAYVKMCNLFFDFNFKTQYPNGSSENDYKADGFDTGDPEFLKNHVWHWTPALIWNAMENGNMTKNYINFYETGEIAPAMRSTSEERLLAWGEYWQTPDDEKTRDDEVYADWTTALQYFYHYANPETASYKLCMDLCDAGYTVTNVDYGGETETGIAYGSSIKDYVVEYYCRYIMGSVDENSWDQFVADWNRMGGELWVQEINEAYAAIH